VNLNGIEILIFIYICKNKVALFIIVPDTIMPDSYIQLLQIYF